MSRASKKLQETILERRKVKAKPVRVINNKKTRIMLFLEEQYEKPIEELIWEESVSELAAKFQVSKFSISYWRKKFPLNDYTIGVNNRKQPKCSDDNELNGNGLRERNGL